MGAKETDISSLVSRAAVALRFSSASSCLPPGKTKVLGIKPDFECRLTSKISPWPSFLSLTRMSAADGTGSISFTMSKSLALEGKAFGLSRWL